jgi:hypothetical protein
LGFLDPGQIVKLGFISYEMVGLNAGPAIEFKPKAARDLDAKARLDNNTLFVTVTALKESMRGARVVFEIRPKSSGSKPFYTAEFSLTDEAGWEGVWSVKEELAALPSNGEFEMFVHPAAEAHTDGD